MAPSGPEALSETDSNGDASSAGKTGGRRRLRVRYAGHDLPLTSENVQARSLGTGHLNSSSTHSRRSNEDQGSESRNTHEMEDRRLDYASRPKDQSAGSSSLLEQLSNHTRQEDEKLTTAEIVRRIRLSCGQFVEEPRVQLFIIVLIVINGIMMGIATFDFVTDNTKVDDAFEATDRAFLVIFTIELALQLIYRSYTFLADSWLIFDFVIVVTSWSLESLQIVRAFRIFRAFRLVTRIGALRELVTALGAVMPRMSAITMLLFLIFYIFAVLFTELFSELELSDNYFGSLDMSLFTCMEMMTLEWAETAREVMDQKSWAWAPLLSFISITGFIVFNLIVAVVCDAVAVVDRDAFNEKYPDILTDKQKLEETQERIWELTETVEILMLRQERLLTVADLLAQEVRSSVLSPTTTAAPPPAPPLRSAMKHSARAAATNEALENEILHFSGSDAEEDENTDLSKQADEQDLKELDALTTSIEHDVRTAIEKIATGVSSFVDPAGSSPSLLVMNGDTPSKPTAELLSQDETPLVEALSDQ